MTTHTITKKVFASKSYYSMEALHEGLGLESLMLLCKGSPEYDVEVGVAEIHITIYDKPVGHSREELMARRDKLVAQHQAQMNALQNQIEDAQ